MTDVPVLVQPVRPLLKLPSANKLTAATAGVAEAASAPAQRMSIATRFMTISSIDTPLGTGPEPAGQSILIIPTV
jgi:hypothetical protein